VSGHHKAGADLVVRGDRSGPQFFDIEADFDVGAAMENEVCSISKTRACESLAGEFCSPSMDYFESQELVRRGLFGRGLRRDIDQLR